MHCRSECVKARPRSREQGLQGHAGRSKSSQECGDQRRSQTSPKRLGKILPGTGPLAQVIKSPSRRKVRFDSLHNSGGCLTASLCTAHPCSLADTASPMTATSSAMTAASCISCLHRVWQAGDSAPHRSVALFLQSACYPCSREGPATAAASEQPTALTILIAQGGPANSSGKWNNLCTRSTRRAYWIWRPQR